MDELTQIRNALPEILRATDAILKSEPEQDDSAREAAGVYVEITKADLEFGVIYGIASIANVIDRQGDVIRPSTLRKAAHSFIRNHNAANVNHASDMPGKFVESWFEGDEWHVGFKPDSMDIAKAAAAGDYVGFSIEGAAKRVKVTSA